MRYPKSDHCDGRVFFNLDPNAVVDKSLWDVLKWKASNGGVPWPSWTENTHTPQLPAAPVANGAVHITMVNHASLLVQLASLTVLTDPVFSARVSPFSFAGPKRVRPPGIPIEALPPLDAVVVSHNHYDHLNLASLQSLNERYHPLFIVPLGNKELLTGAGINNVVELDWWQAHPMGPHRSITLVPAQHWSARSLNDRCQTLWGGYVMRAGDTQVFFAGDTGYGPHFKLVSERLGPMDVALLPIGAYEPRWFMATQHMNPDDAVQAHLDLRARQSLGMHWGTFQLTDEAQDQPPKDLKASLEARNVPPAQFVPLENGQTFSAAFHQAE